MLDRGLFVRRLDWHAAPYAAAGNRGFYLDRAAGEPLRYTSSSAPCPSSGLIIHGDKDAVVPPRDVTDLVEKLKHEKGIVIEQKVVPGANHFFDDKVEPLVTSIGGISRQAARRREAHHRRVNGLQ